MIINFYEGPVFWYCVILFILYLALSIWSAQAIRKYLNLQAFRKEFVLMESSFTPGISIVAPAYNERAGIVDNVRSLLTLNYPRFEVIIVNDGSTDDTLELLIEEFNLEETPFAYDPKIGLLGDVKRFFKSADRAHAKLLVIDKVNGGSKADSVNAGMNAAAFPYLLNADVDGVLDKDTLLRLIQPIMDSEKRVIGVGAPLRIANSCEIDSGVITRVRPPKSLLGRFQELEYIRSFILGKMGWSHINAVPNVSGGLGLFDTEILIKAGGYDPHSFGEDMEMVYRMAGYMCNNKEDYVIQYIPQALCWTEGPQTLKSFVRQRSRWARGLMQIFGKHWKMLLNPRYGKMGLIVFPYNFFFELLAPVVELGGIAYFIYLVITGGIAWSYLPVLLLFVWSFSIMISTIAVLWDQLVFRQYKHWGEVVSVAAMAITEPFIYHPVILFSSVKGYLNHLFRIKKKWGNLEKKGFRSEPSSDTRIVTDRTTS